jgi:biopolymer transport protein ExbD
MKFSQTPRRAAEISLTPLIDILFIVLLFLVLTATLTEQSVLRVSLPKAATGEPIADDRSVVRVQIDADGQAYLDGVVQPLDAIRARLARIDDPDRARVIIAADSAASHGSVVQVLDLVRQAGIVRVGIVTFTESAQNNPR